MKVDQGSRALLDALCFKIASLVSPAMGVFVLDVYSKDHDTAVLPKLLRSGGKVKGGMVDAEAAWSILQRSRELYGASPETVVEVKNDEASFDGVSHTAGSRWAAPLVDSRRLRVMLCLGRLRYHTRRVCVCGRLASLRSRERRDAT